MSNNLKQRIDAKNRDEAQAAFAGYVQSVAFHMTLSRNMIDALRLVRDFGTPGGGDTGGQASRYVMGHSVPLVLALERRGLVWHDYIPFRDAPRGHRYHKLTKAGELMCDLLVEAGLMAAAERTSRRGASS